MNPPGRQLTALVPLIGALLLLAAPGAAAETVAPLPTSDYGVTGACSAPAPGHAACLALQLVPQTSAARARTHPLGVTRAPVLSTPSPTAGSYGLRPADLHSAYTLPDDASGVQTIALVDAYNDPNAQSDLSSYSETFGLPSCTAAGECFRVVNQRGESGSPPFPETNSALESALGAGGELRREAIEARGWDLEISLDIEAAHATCQNCHIVLVEANDSSYANLEAAEHEAESLGADEISNSFGGPEVGASVEEESASAFKHPGTVITVAAGDTGYLSWDAEYPEERGYANFPASSPHVVAVGGTRLTLTGGGTRAEETVWNGSGAGGGGCSEIFSAPVWQRDLSNWSSVGCGGKRAVADVSAVADPYTGLAVHDTSAICEHSYEEGGVQHHAYWCTIGGTSLASPVIASVFALAGGADEVPYPARTLYVNQAAAPSSLYDVTSGSNGACESAYDKETGLSGCSLASEAASCAAQLICRAGTGYDGPSGLGAPSGLAAFEASPAEIAEPISGEEGGEPAGEGSGTSGNGRPTHGGGREVVTFPISTSGGGATGGGYVPPVGLQISGLTLTTRALVALNRSRPRVSALYFSFRCNATGPVRLRLEHQVRHGHRKVWKTIVGPHTFTVQAGGYSGHIAGSLVLKPGAYMLALAPEHGSAHSLRFHIG